ncbi:DNA-binding domain-containing protein [Corallincola spongiicola]|uniref:DUF2063 domain-containing protein n=1 Tax=Corallincola spongiicola TaxID=2520508 RepID=A0ABY1WSJ7_9GAMM|nr:putative DNA-binding domain-containing protein [Corallincola spongiicola]TAA47705.1 DUF2063 domain-containing protein [Corallincola spongiicola]
MRSFQVIQYELTEHIRQPLDNKPPSGIEERRLKVYRELFFNNVKGFIDSAFPVLHSLYHEDEWLLLVRQFFACHDCRSPIFLDISNEFVTFLADEYQLGDADPTFMRELAHYEWVELAVSAALDTESDGFVATAPETSERLMLANTAMVVSYQYPVHHISVEFQPAAVGEQPTYLAVYRDRQDEVCFLELNAMTAQLLQMLSETPGGTITTLAEQLIAVAPQFNIEQLTGGVAQIVAQLSQRGIIRHFHSD